MIQSCRNCRFFDGGACKRHAPTLVWMASITGAGYTDPSTGHWVPTLGGGSYCPMWPYVLPYQWCGDWEQKKEVVT
jgi:hypothetical protein